MARRKRKGPCCQALFLQGCSGGRTLCVLRQGLQITTCRGLGDLWSLRPVSQREPYPASPSSLWGPVHPVTSQKTPEEKKDKYGVGDEKEKVHLAQIVGCKKVEGLTLYSCILVQVIIKVMKKLVLLCWGPDYVIPWSVMRGTHCKEKPVWNICNLVPKQYFSILWSLLSQGKTCQITGIIYRYKKKHYKQNRIEIKYLTNHKNGNRPATFY